MVGSLFALFLGFRASGLGFRTQDVGLGTW